MMDDWTSVKIGGRDVKKIELDGGVLWELAPGVVVGTVTGTGRTITVSGLPFTPDGVMIVCIAKSTSTDIRSAAYIPADSVGYFVKCSAAAKNTTGFIASMQSGEFTIGAERDAWESGAKYFVAWRTGAGVYGEVAASGKEITVDGLGFLPSGVFAMTAYSSTSSNYIRSVQKDTQGEVEALLFNCAGNQSGSASLTVSEGSATFGNASTSSAFPSTGRTSYFIWK